MKSHPFKWFIIGFNVGERLLDRFLFSSTLIPLFFLTHTHTHT